MKSISTLQFDSINTGRSEDTTKMPLINLVISEERRNFRTQSNPFKSSSSIFSSSTITSAHSNKSSSTLAELNKSSNNSLNKIKESSLIFDGIIIEK